MRVHGVDLVPGVQACMHEPLMSDSAVRWRGEAWVDSVVDISVFMGYEV